MHVSRIFYCLYFVEYSWIWSTYLGMFTTYLLLSCYAILTNIDVVTVFSMCSEYTSHAEQNWVILIYRVCNTREPDNKTPSGAKHIPTCFHSALCFKDLGEAKYTSMSSSLKTSSVWVFFNINYIYVH